MFADMPKSAVKQPAYFIPHGAGPCFFMNWNPTGTWQQMAAFLSGIEAQLPMTPTAILLISAHWQEDAFTLTAAAKPGLIYDYFGFPESTYQLTYPAPGAPELAATIAKRISAAGLPSRLDQRRGLDHGAFIPLKLMFAKADIPVVQLSLQRGLDAAAHLQLGEALAPLREQGVLIVGSGMSFHNMRGYGDPRYTAPSEKFDHWLTEAVQAAPAARYTLLQQWQSAPCAVDCHPLGGEEHLLPLMVVVGAAAADKGSKVYSENVLCTQLSAFRFD
ncbi:MAG: dioxygenase [Rheinheimera sp.]|uniref:DODA-type extradiol aromatic ring-opening family dioxygenase n=1 Tax=Arsukibacterium sp. UBA3155 TaxID=1946058 RepID=UPI000C96E184|nr:class III extradiol ring-cleavage dioxygenase [Arsukibacterium sp. UBA3155]MAD74644.1 dioxygenase [Rheinheimera sp.]|tara:strand:- start:79775 stop:80599 length:825 start_codon:yes stop_codon:yes gene_type:complete